MANELEMLEGKLTKLEEFLPVVQTVLTEVKAALDNALLNPDPARIKAASDRVGKVIDALVAMGKAADITPETPVDDPDPDDPGAPA